MPIALKKLPAHPFKGIPAVIVFSLFQVVTVIRAHAVQGIKSITQTDLEIPWEFYARNR
ncbi:hypothetical protein Pvag_pPag30104 (plasmid) [Pantoea vagans C9-1]|nr:hypothetical protein Pvag_pPag30104 [Pantoea vagans C9-1]